MKPDIEAKNQVDTLAKRRGKKYVTYFEEYSATSSDLNYEDMFVALLVLTAPYLVYCIVVGYLAWLLFQIPVEITMLAPSGLLIYYIKLLLVPVSKEHDLKVRVWVYLKSLTGEEDLRKVLDHLFSFISLVKIVFGLFTGICIIVVITLLYARTRQDVFAYLMKHIFDDTRYLPTGQSPFIEALIQYMHNLF